MVVGCTSFHHHTKKESLSGGRFELPTQGFSVLCSNQLSYPDKKNSRNRIFLLLILRDVFQDNTTVVPLVFEGNTTKQVFLLA